MEGVLESMAVGIAAKALILDKRLELGPWLVMGDQTRLRQILINLVNNAVKFTPKGGTVRVALVGSGPDIELVVSDNGQGIAPPLLSHVFEIFKQGDAGGNKRSQGLGLGLAIVHNLVELHGGSVSVRSAGEGAGASFHVRLPRAPAT